MNLFQTLRWHPSGAQAKCGPCFVCLVRCVALYCDHDTLHSTQCYVRGFVRKTCLQNSFKIGMFCKCPLLSQETNLAQAIQTTSKRCTNIPQPRFCVVRFLLTMVCVQWWSDTIIFLFQKWITMGEGVSWSCTDWPMYRAWNSCKRRNLPAIMGWSW